jgi:hypothetical protein
VLLKTIIGESEYPHLNAHLPQLICVLKPSLASGLGAMWNRKSSRYCSCSYNGREFHHAMLGARVPSSFFALYVIDLCWSSELIMKLA